MKIRNLLLALVSCWAFIADAQVNTTPNIGLQNPIPGVTPGGSITTGWDGGYSANIQFDINKIDTQFGCILDGGCGGAKDAGPAVDAGPQASNKIIFSLSFATPTEPEGYTYAVVVPAGSAMTPTLAGGYCPPNGSYYGYCGYEGGDGNYWGWQAYNDAGLNCSAVFATDVILYPSTVNLDAGFYSVPFLLPDGGACPSVAAGQWIQYVWQNTGSAGENPDWDSFNFWAIY